MKKPFVIYQMFWVGTKWRKWTSYATKDEALAALGRLNASPSGKYYAYNMLKDKTQEAP